MCKFKTTALLLLMIAILSPITNYAFSVERVKMELLDNKFRLSIPNDPDIKWVAYNVNINKEFHAFEAGQLSGLINRPEDRKWSYEFERNLNDGDLVYIWLGIQYGKIVFRDKQGPFSVEAVRRGDPNPIVASPHLGTGSPGTTSSTTTTTTAATPTAIDTRIKTPDEDKLCFPTITEVSIDRKHCKGDLLFEENFDQLSPDRWTNEVRIPSNENDAEFSLYNGTAFVEEGKLKIAAKLYTNSITSGTIDLQDRCTSINYAECRLQAQSSYYLPPVLSGRINSKQSFNFKYGRVEVRAKLPKGDWLVPLISLEPSVPKYGFKHYTNGEMRLAFARGNHRLMSDGVNIDGTRLFGGVIVTAAADERHRFMANVSLDKVNGLTEHFGNQFHVYSLIWKPNELLLSVDDYVYGTIRTNFKESLNEPAWRLGPDNAPLDQMYYITLGLSVGGHGDFPNHAENKPWQNLSPRASLHFYNKRGDWHPWERPVLEVDYVRVYAI